MPRLPKGVSVNALDDDLRSLADEAGKLAAKLDSTVAGYFIGTLYTAALPDDVRAAQGVYYTPPALVERLLLQAERAGVDWATARALDPACGGGAFMAPVALRMKAAINGLPPDEVLNSIIARLHGWEIDPFAAWVSHVMLEAAMLDVCLAAKRRLPRLIDVRDSLAEPPAAGSTGVYDLVIANPPYSRITLPPDLRKTYARSLYGHANLYGVFTDLALRLTRSGGVVAYVTPTSFLGGEYYKNLRALLLREAPPFTIDLVEARRDVFADVLQETLLATYRRGGGRQDIAVAFLDADERTVAVRSAGHFHLPEGHPHDPWPLPRDAAHADLVRRLLTMTGRLSDLGYTVSTGPLVWNRVKPCLKSKPGKGRVPIIWAEAVLSDGRFSLAYEKRQDVAWFEPQRGHGALMVRTPCVLVQRTTAKEQARRLIAAVMPPDLLARYGAVTVENHVNMVRPINGAPVVPPAVVAALLNSEAVDQAFRCLSGSVAVSAFELESVPLPCPEELAQVAQLVAEGRPRDAIERAVRACYENARGDTRVVASTADHRGDTKPS